MTPPLGNKILNLCSGAKNVFIAAPYIKYCALNKVLNELAEVDSLVCITRWKPADIRLGASDIECRQLVIDRKGSFRIHTSLHAKYYRIDNAIFVGSANLTMSGMGWVPHPNFEILVQLEGTFDDKNFEYDLIQHSAEVDDREYLLWESLAAVDRSIETLLPENTPMLDTWKPLTRDLRNLELAYTNRQDEIASEDERGAAFSDIRAISIPMNLPNETFRSWIAASMIASPFVNTAMRLNNEDRDDVVKILSDRFGFSMFESRRGLEAVENWIRFFNLESLVKTSTDSNNQ